MSSPPRYPTNDLHRISSHPSRPLQRSAAVPPQPQQQLASPQRPPSHHPRSEDDLTWLQFLRTAGGTVPEQEQRAISAERKRKNTAAESERRIYPYHTFAGGSSRVPARYNRPSSAMSPTRPESGTRTAPVDLITPPRRTSSISTTIDPNQLRRTSTNTSTRRESDTVLPKWQPDNSVSSCPVCNTAFGFWNRRHHCRKCGRVVCANCSPHRITIPRQYIVQPPNPYLAEFGLEEVEQRDEQARRELGGGEVVRVCNPCVPDPWTPEVPSLARTGSEEGAARARPLIDGARNAGEVERQRSDRYRYMPAPANVPQGTRNRSQSHQPISAPFSRSIPVSNSPLGRPPPSNNASAYLGNAPQPPPHHTRPSSHRYSHSTHIPLPTSSRPPITTAPSAPPQPRPRRVVKEEDECPVCGIEMPPGDQVREAHIQECIATRFSSGTPSTSTAMAPPPPRPLPTDINSGSSDPSPSGSSSLPSSSTPPTTTTRPRAPSHRPRGMALYRATEKDCLDAETGEAVECVICFEEFQPGDEMGRMECLCRFHRTCIRGWWERKGGGSCPTHMLHE